MNQNYSNNPAMNPNQPLTYEQLMKDNEFLCRENWMLKEILHNYGFNLDQELFKLEQFLQNQPGSIQTQIPSSPNPGFHPEPMQHGDLLLQEQAFHYQPEQAINGSSIQPCPSYPSPAEYENPGLKQKEQQEKEKIEEEKKKMENAAKILLEKLDPRRDVYANRFIIKESGKAGYSPACFNLFKNGCGKLTNKDPKTKKNPNEKYGCSNCSIRQDKPLTCDVVVKHLKGETLNDRGKPVDFSIGIYPMHPDNTCKFLVFDFDFHESDINKELEKSKASDSKKVTDLAVLEEDEIWNGGADAAKEANWKEDADCLRQVCQKYGVPLLTEISRSGSGAHLWLIFEKRIEASKARRFAEALLHEAILLSNQNSLHTFDRVIPTQDYLPNNGYGNLIALPFQGKCRPNHTSVLVDENWRPLAEQVFAFKNSKEIREEQIKSVMNQIQQERKNHASGIPIYQNADPDQPWNKRVRFQAEDAKVPVEITLSDELYISKEGLQPRLANQIRLLAALENPEYTKNQYMRISNYKNHRYLYYGREAENHIILPRQLFEELEARLKEGNIPFHLNDQRVYGEKLRVSFTGTLRDYQKKVVEELAASQGGILEAPTGSGKTVILAAVIARKKCRTLILVNKISLVDMWKERLEQFLDFSQIDPALYSAPGSAKKKKSPVGVYTGNKKDLKGLIDVATVQSLENMNQDDLLCKYGMIIYDECHHAPANTSTRLLNKIPAMFRFGCTATPERTDKLDKVTYMYLGQIISRVTQNQMLSIHNLRFHLRPRHTSFVLPNSGKGSIHYQEALKLAAKDPVRNRMIAEDVTHIVQQGRTPLVFTSRKEHIKLLKNALEGAADHLYVLTGQTTSKEREQMLEEMQNLPDKESMILLCTDQTAGEGFDLPRLDTLFLTTPFSSKTSAIQFAGRIHRMAPGKTDAVIYDYIDDHVKILGKSFRSRVQTYLALGYEVQNSDSQRDSESFRVVYEAENYEQDFLLDLHLSKEQIILSTPDLREYQVDRFLRECKDLMADSVKVHLVTSPWSSNSFDSGDKESIIEKLRKNGFEVSIVNRDVKRFAIFDKEVVWYGSLNMLSGFDSSDTIIRETDIQMIDELLLESFGRSATKKARSNPGRKKKLQQESENEITLFSL